MSKRCSINAAPQAPTPALGVIPTHLMQWAAVRTKLLAIKVPPHVCLHVLSFRYWREIWRRGHMSVHRDPHPMSLSSHLPPLTSHPCNSAYLPGPAVGHGIFSSHHPGC